MAQRHKFSWLKVWLTDKQNLILYFSMMDKILVQAWTGQHNWGDIGVCH